MKTAFILSSILIGGSLLLEKPSLERTHSNAPASSTKLSSFKRGFEIMPKAPIRIVVDKSNYELYVYDSEGWFATYPVVFGNSSLDDKKMEGDRLTPEGSFKIVNKKIHEKWYRFMGLDYPTRESLEKFNQRKKKGEVPQNSSPGGGIGIHGTWPHEDFQIDRYKNWTNGCIALKNEDMDDLYSYITVGTPISIQK